MDFLLYTIHALVCVFLILVVLLQQGKGADLSVFGGGSTQTAFGARGATTFLHKLTVASFVIFVLTTLAIGILAQGGGRSVMRHAPLSSGTPVGSKSSPAPTTPKVAPVPAKPVAATTPAATTTPATTTTPAAAPATPPPATRPPAASH